MTSNQSLPDPHPPHEERAHRGQILIMFAFMLSPCSARSACRSISAWPSPSAAQCNRLPTPAPMPARGRC